jgi:hypothetical protein
VRQVPAVDLQPGDRVQLPGGLVRTVLTVMPYTAPGWDHLVSVKYREGRTAEWSAGNSSGRDTLWEVLDT